MDARKRKENEMQHIENDFLKVKKTKTEAKQIISNLKELAVAKHFAFKYCKESQKLYYLCELYKILDAVEYYKKEGVDYAI